MLTNIRQMSEKARAFAESDEEEEGNKEDEDEYDSEESGTEESGSEGGGSEAEEEDEDLPELIEDTADK